MLKKQVVELSKRSIENHSKSEKLAQYSRRQNHYELEHFCTNFEH